MSSPPGHESDDELRVTGKSGAQWKDEEKPAKAESRSQAVTSSTGDDWRRWKDNPANKDYIILNTLGRGAFADVRCNAGSSEAAPMSRYCAASAAVRMLSFSVQRRVIQLLARIQRSATAACVCHETTLLRLLQVVLGKHRQTQKQHALKVVYLNKPGLKDKHIAVLQREGVYLRKLQHKNIVRCLRVYQAPQQWVFVLEYLKGGMLLNDLAKVRPAVQHLPWTCSTRKLARTACDVRGVGVELMKSRMHMMSGQSSRAQALHCIVLHA